MYDINCYTLNMKNNKRMDSSMCVHVLLYIFNLFSNLLSVKRECVQFIPLLCPV